MKIYVILEESVILRKERGRREQKKEGNVGPWFSI